MEQSEAVLTGERRFTTVGGQEEKGKEGQLDGGWTSLTGKPARGTTQQSCWEMSCADCLVNSDLVTIEDAALFKKLFAAG